MIDLAGQISEISIFRNNTTAACRSPSELFILRYHAIRPLSSTWQEQRQSKHFDAQIIASRPKLLLERRQSIKILGHKAFPSSQASDKMGVICPWISRPALASNSHLRHWRGRMITNRLSVWFSMRYLHQDFILDNSSGVFETKSWTRNMQGGMYWMRGHRFDPGDHEYPSISQNAWSIVIEIRLLAVNLYSWKTKTVPRGWQKPCQTRTPSPLVGIEFAGIGASRTSSSSSYC